ncbi:MAG: LapA family protein [bacterium]
MMRYVEIILILILFLIVVVITAQNRDEVMSLRFLAWKTESVPTVAVISGAFVVGALLVATIGIVDHIRLKREINRNRKTIGELQGQKRQTGGGTMGEGEG